MGRLGDEQGFPAEAFADVLAANSLFAAQFGAARLPSRAQRRLAILTCIDSRIDPLGATGMQAGDVVIARNAGARVTDDVMRTVVLATMLLHVERILILPHTDCRMAGSDEPAIHRTIAERYGVDTRSLEFRTVNDQMAALRDDVVRVRSLPFLPAHVTVGGGIYDVADGRIIPVDA